MYNVCNVAIPTITWQASSLSNRREVYLSQDMKVSPFSPQQSGSLTPTATLTSYPPPPPHSADTTRRDSVSEPHARSEKVRVKIWLNEDLVKIEMSPLEIGYAIISKVVSTHTRTHIHTHSSSQYCSKVVSTHTRTHIHTHSSSQYCSKVVSTHTRTRIHTHSS